MQEYNFDGLVGPTHNYAGLSIGNVASTSNVNTTSNPRAAALQGLAKMKLLSDHGVPQAILPPQIRPDLGFLRALGFQGATERILQQAYKYAPRLFAASYSASSMWTANAATVTPSKDSLNGKLHLTPANLASNIHRSIEAEGSYTVLSKIFSEQKYFTVHQYLPQSQELGDEGAANHTRFCNKYSDNGINLFVYGQEYYNKNSIKPKIYPARQTLEASSAIARLHGLNPDTTLFLQQDPEIIDQGVFHNDVCAVGNADFLFCYERSFLDQKNNLNKLQNICNTNGINLKIYEVATKDLSPHDMVKSYLFNSQIVITKSGSHKPQITLIAPTECEEYKSANLVINNLIEQSYINNVIYIDCKQSMRNGGGPACLRLRVVLSPDEVAAIKKSANVILTEGLYEQLVAWVKKYYRENIALSDLLDPTLADESYTALDRLYEILNL